MPNVYNFDLKRGETFSRTIVWSIDGVRPDLTGVTATMDFREEYGDPVIVLQLTSGSGGGITIDTVNRTVKFLITAAQAAAIEQMSLVTDLKLSNVTSVPDQPEKYLFQGSVSIYPSVTP